MSTPMNHSVNEVLTHIRFDEDGLLSDPDQWNEGVALALAYQEGISTLTDAHWQVLHALRKYYFKYHAPPPMSMICRDAETAMPCVQQLFHTCLAAWRIAGLPYPGEEAKSYLGTVV